MDEAEQFGHQIPESSDWDALAILDAWPSWQPLLPLEWEGVPPVWWLPAELQG